MRNRLSIGMIVFCLIWVPIFANTNWRRITRGSIVLYCYAIDLKSGEKIVNLASETVPIIAKDLRLEQITTITIVLASSEREFHTLTGGQIPEWGIGGADPGRSTIFIQSPRIAQSRSQLSQVVIHELSHVLLGQVVQGHQVDRWFDEGFAMYESGEGGISGSIQLARNLISRDHLFLDDVEEMLSFQRSKASLAYQISCSAIQYLVDEYGLSSLSNIAWQLREGVLLNQALESTIGLDFQTFESEWFTAVKKKYQWYILLDFRLMLSAGFVVLFILAFMGTRRRIHKKKQQWAMETLYEEAYWKEDTEPD